MEKIIQTCLIIVMLILGFYITAKISYESGQIDALKGEQHFKFVTNTVQNVTWQKIK